MDTKVLMTQQWLNETYAGTSGYSAVDEDGITGMGTIRALIWALQTELGISADGVFGDGTAKAFTALSTESDSSITTINHQIHILQGALYCKGQGLDPIYLNGVYTDTTKEAVRKFQEYAGLSTTDQTGIANAEVMKALLNTDAYTLLRSGDSKIREIQQALNNKYHSYIGLIPCDGLFTKKTMRALISGLQAKRRSRSLFPAAQGWLPLTSPSFGRSWPMTSWSLTASGIGKRRCSLSSRTLRKPIISLWLWPFRRCSICCARGPTMFTEAACPTMYGCCGTRPPTQGRFPSLKRSWLSSVPVRSA